ncbi:MAG: hypothetical protein EOP45_17105 [Sphingobacteriaceae bacterium]|nr:MAG: hypothetical protein EOP45_17105 [Sphingobacteriaceae bacterium]
MDILFHDIPASTTELVVYRGLTRTPIIKGSQIIFRSYSSVSFLEEIAIDFMDDPSSVNTDKIGRKTLLKIVIKPGRKLLPLYLLQNDSIQDEQEMVLPRGTILRIKERTMIKEVTNWGYVNNYELIECWM